MEDNESKYYRMGLGLGNSGSTSDDDVWTTAFKEFGDDLTEEIADEIRRGVADGWRMYQEANWVTRYTTAPEAYDGFGTTSLGVVAAMSSRAGSRREYRKVLIDPENLKWQEMRYASGMNACVDVGQLRDLQGLHGFEIIDLDKID